MPSFETLQENQQHSLSTTELKKVLAELKDKSPGVSIRYRLLGEMWTEPYFHYNIMLSDEF
jgi:hypothetical protein